MRARLSAADNAHRPSLTGRPMLDEIEHVLAARDDLYRSLAHHTINVDLLSPDAALAAITTAASSPTPTP